MVVCRAAGCKSGALFATRFVRILKYPHPNTDNPEGAVDETGGHIATGVNTPMANWVELLAWIAAVGGGLLLLAGVSATTRGAELMLGKYAEMLRSARPDRPRSPEPERKEASLNE